MFLIWINLFFLRSVVVCCTSWSTPLVCCTSWSTPLVWCTSLLHTTTEHHLRSQRTPERYKFKVNNSKLIELLIRIELTRANFNATILKFSEKFDRPFSHVFIFGKIFLESHGFVAMPVTSRIIDTCSNLSLSDWWRETKLFDLVTGTSSKPWLTGNTLPNIKTCKNGWSNFSEYLETPKSINLQLFTLISYGVGGPLWCWHL